jgi:hypothetical protein
MNAAMTEISNLRAKKGRDAWTRGYIASRLEWYTRDERPEVREAARQAIRERGE